MQDVAGTSCSKRSDFVLEVGMAHKKHGGMFAKVISLCYICMTSFFGGVNFLYCRRDVDFVMRPKGVVDFFFNYFYLYEAL
jgi:hypothetical protein